MVRLLTALCLFSFLFVVIAAESQTAAPSNSSSAPPATSSGDSNDRLPVKRVVLYKNGVGHFEHSARVHGNQDLSIDFTTAQLNDVLKSLTVVDLGEGHISSVRYNSIAPLQERLKALRLPFGEDVTQADYLSALRGRRVEVRSGASAATGRLLSVETEQRSTDKGVAYTVTKFSVIADSGEMKNFELGTGTTVRLAERDLNGEVSKYLDLIGSSRARDLRRMTISASGAGDRNIFVSYISEVPVWKSTYRILLPSKAEEKPLLQGWAIVDNTVGEDWKDIQLALVAGAPQSFIQQISQPYYTRRPVVELPTSMMMTPQEHEGTVDSLERFAKLGLDPPPPPPPASGVGGGVPGVINQAQIQELPINGRDASSLIQIAPGVVSGGGLAGTVIDPSGAAISAAQVIIRNEKTGTSQRATSDSQGSYQFYNLPSGSYALSISQPGFSPYSRRNVQVASGRVNAVNITLQVGRVSESVEVESAGLAEVAGKQHVEAEGKDMGDYFEYNVKQPITIGKNQSALVPILQAHIDAEKVSIWNEESKEIRRGLWLTNSSGLTLDSGTFNILDGDTFGGEGLIETLHPAERRLISYAGDPALRITMDEESSEKPATHVRIAKGIMILTREERDSRQYTLHNSDVQPRQVVIEHPAREGWKLGEGVKAEETTESFLRFRVGVGPGKTETLKLEEYHSGETEYELDDLDDDKVKLIVKDNKISPGLQEVFQKVLAQKNQVEALQTQLETRQKEIDAITKDQERVRDNMKALKGSAEEKALLQRYTRQRDSQEDRLDTLHKEIADFQQQHDKADESLDQMMEQITMDENL